MNKHVNAHQRHSQKLLTKVTQKIKFERDRETETEIETRTEAERENKCVYSANKICGMFQFFSSALGSCHVLRKIHASPATHRSCTFAAGKSTGDNRARDEMHGPIIIMHRAPATRPLLRPRFDQSFQVKCVV